MPEERRTQEQWLMCYQFPDMETAAKAYGRARDIIFGRDVDASVYRVQIASVPHVIVTGDGPLADELRKKFEEACANSQLTDIPVEVMTLLSKRRAAGRLPGFFWEANYRQQKGRSHGRPGGDAQHQPGPQSPP